MAGELEDDKSAYVVVVGDVGRSPRMCNHALSLAQVVPTFCHCFLEVLVVDRKRSLNIVPVFIETSSASLSRATGC